MDKLTIETYNLYAAAYDDETKEFWDTFPRTFIDQFSGLVQGRRILDVGSGPGRDGLLLQNMGFSVTCLDASSSMIALCRTRGLKATLGNFADIPFPDESFDGAWAYTSLLHIRRAEIGDALLEMRRILKQDGILGIGMIEGNTEEYRENMGVNSPRLFTYYSKIELENLLHINGFDILSFEQLTPGSRNYLHFIVKKR